MVQYDIILKFVLFYCTQRLWIEKSSFTTNKVHINFTISKTFTKKQKIKIANSNNYVN